MSPDHHNVARLPVVSKPTTAADGTISRVSPPKTPRALVQSFGGTDIREKVRIAAVFKDTFPAWNNMNLRELCLATSSDCIVAHIRAASPGTGVNLNNCHPFKAGRLLFCHNGRIFGYQQIKRRFLSQLNDEAFLSIKGTTDSEGVFGLYLTCLANDDDGTACSPFAQTAPFGEKRLVAAMKKTLSKIGQILDGAYADGYPQDYSTCNFAVTDGETMVVTRYCDASPTVPPPSLYFAFGSSLQHELTSDEMLTPPAFEIIQEEKKESSASEGEVEDDNQSRDSSHDDSDFDISKVLLQRRESKPGKMMAQVDPNTATFVVSSNPLTNTHCWHKMPKNSIMWCTRGKHPELRLLSRRSPSNIDGGVEM